MFSKKVLRIGLMAVALMSCSMVTLAEEKKDEKKSEIFISALQTPPPGYIVEKSFGSNGTISSYTAFSLITSNDIIKAMDKAEQLLKEKIREMGGNAVLAEKINTQVTGNDGNKLFVIIQGEFVILKPAGK